MADKRTFDLSALVDQASAYILADRDDLAEAQKLFLVNVITQATLQIFAPGTSGLTSTNTQDAIKELVSIVKNRMQWQGVWDDTRQYYNNDVVRADTWLMIATVDTPAIGVSPIPTPVNEPYYAINLGESPIWETVNTTSWFYTGLRAVNNVGPKLIVGGRAWLQNTANIRQLVVLSLIDSDGDSNELGSKVFEDGDVTVTGWAQIMLPSPVIVYQHQVYEIGLFTESLGGETILFNDSWVYNGVNNSPTNVYYGSATQSSSATTLYIHQYSFTGSGPYDFSTMQAEDIITQTSGSSEWAFELSTAPTYSSNADVWQFTGAYLYKIGEINSGLTVDYEFLRPGGGSLDYVKITDGLTGFDNFTGYLDTLPTNDAYGVDFYLDDIYQNPQWDIMSHYGRDSSLFFN